jgi:hypothetical protein
MYLRVTINRVLREKAWGLKALLAEMDEHRAANGYTPVEWLTGLTGTPEQLISVQRYEKLADYEAALAQIANDPTYIALLGRLKDSTVAGEGDIQILKTY